MTSIKNETTEKYLKIKVSNEYFLNNILIF